MLGSKGQFQQREFSFQQVVPVDVTVKNLQISAKVGRFKRRLRKRAKEEDEESAVIQPILHSTSFQIPSGSILAIIGGSGSGKTTLLNSLAARIGSSNSLLQSGEVRFNGGSLNQVRHAYVIQQDILSPSLTARETLQFAAELRLPDITSSQERSQLVEEVILELGLKDCADTAVGDSTHKGLSGGEKRRLSLGIQLLSNPSVLFLDEPTTGLDANSALLLVQTLQSLARRGRTIIISIHQPRSDIFFLFDRLCILTKGRCVYNGKVDAVLGYFEDQGFTVPDNVNPADYLIDITSVDTRNAQDEFRSYKRVEQLVDAWLKHQKDEEELQSKPLLLSEKPKLRVPFLRQLNVLVRRDILLSYRNTLVLISLYLEAIVIGVVCGWVFHNPKHDIRGIRTITSAIYSSNSLQGYLLILFETYRLTANDIKLFDRERSEGCTTVPGFLISRRISKLIVEDLAVPLLFSVITYFMYGLTRTARQFFIYFITVFLVHQTSMCGATLGVAISRNFAQASLLANLMYTLQTMACGYFVNAKYMPVYVRWTKYIAHIWYGFGALISNEFTGFVGDCPSDNPLDCTAYDGKYIIKTLGFWENWIAVPVVVILCWAIVYYLLAGAVLVINKNDVSLSKQIVSKESAVESTQEFEKEVVTDNDNGIVVELQDIELSVKLNKSLYKKYNKPILNKINANFKPGELNAIMGPSGSGKSSLLNLISGRLNSGLFTDYKYSGNILFNGLCVSNNMVNSICSYVSQDDDHLLAAMTVRETLTIAGDLRLGSKSKQEKKQIVDGVILKLGLKNCEHTLIGNEFMKGISGGEKRRVSIGIQLLNNPKVLLLDEPTSGLDSFTASSILEILQELSDEGKTVIMTIHQPRSDLFRQFGSVLLLSKGGKVCYNGEQSKMIDFFKSLGYECPKLTNSADFVLDLISINTQSVEKEAFSRERVGKLLGEWEKKVISHEPISIISNEKFRAEFGRYIRSHANFMPALYACLKQMILMTVRDKQVLVARLTQVGGMGIITALFFAPLKSNYIGVTNTLGLIQQVTSVYFCGMLNNLSSYPLQRNYFYHEYEDNVYGILPFFMSYIIIELPFEIWSALLFAIFLVPIIGLKRHSAPMFFSVAYVVLMIVNCGESLGIITNTLFREPGFAVNMISIALSIGTFMAGTMSLDMDRVLKGINYISPLKYGLSILLNLSFKDTVIKCDDESECVFQTGEQVLETYGIQADYIKYFGVLVCVCIIYRILAYLLLKLKLFKYGIKHSVH